MKSNGTLAGSICKLTVAIEGLERGAARAGIKKRERADGKRSNAEEREGDRES